MRRKSCLLIGKNVNLEGLGVFCFAIYVVWSILRYLSWKSIALK